MLGTIYAAKPTVRLRPRASADSYGDPVLDHSNPTRSRIRGAMVQPRPASEDETPSATSLRDERVLYAVGVVDLTASDRVEVEGAVWRVEATPIVYHGLASGAHTFANLVRLSTV